MFFLKIKKTGASGAGFLIDSAGIIITNWHVVEKADQSSSLDAAKRRCQVPKMILFQDIDPFIGAVLSQERRSRSCIS